MAQGLTPVSLTVSLHCDWTTSRRSSNVPARHRGKVPHSIQSNNLNAIVVSLYDVEMGVIVIT